MGVSLVTCNQISISDFSGQLENFFSQIKFKAVKTQKSVIDFFFLFCALLSPHQYNLT